MNILLTFLYSSTIAREEFDRIFVQLTGCMEHFLMEMKKGVFLVQKFPCERQEGKKSTFISVCLCLHYDSITDSETRFRISSEVNSDETQQCEHTVYRPALFVLHNDLHDVC